MSSIVLGGSSAFFQKMESILLFSKYMVFQNMVFQKNFFESIVFQIDSKNFILIYSFPKYGFPKKISLNL